MLDNAALAARGFVGLVFSASGACEPRGDACHLPMMNKSFFPSDPCFRGLGFFVSRSIQILHFQFARNPPAP
jgi:hypothetical protein